MDLSNLSNTLPSSKPISRQSKTQPTEEDQISQPPSTSTSQSSTTSSDISSELTSYFKDAAKAVASLYNISLNSSTTNESQKSSIKSDFANAAKSVASLYKLGQISHLVSQDKGYIQCIDDLLEVITNDEDIENWALTRRAEIINHKKSSNGIRPTTQSTTTMEDSKLPSDFEFHFKSELKPPTNFKPSIPPISVQHNQSQRNLTLKKSKLQQQYHKKFHSSEESSESETDDGKRVKLFKEFSNSPVKKKKKKN
ncbi:hypothetical protein KGF54_002383 [Candida jiufengensis]|uniref:uncharacterized protein n=1 Tax=Candida jiufengensis TaxID=497108 RepID=UPI0022255CB9|nr:uncharacterized protein KGF54_002383 [Candida jiufengensis]KAI5954608.1 hypothetical protein KGF54_002383 [Candida jiufengensis]